MRPVRNPLPPFWYEPRSQAEASSTSSEEFQESSSSPSYSQSSRMSEPQTGEDKVDEAEASPASIEMLRSPPSSSQRPKISIQRKKHRSSHDRVVKVAKPEKRPRSRPPKHSSAKQRPESQAKVTKAAKPKVNPKHRKVSSADRKPQPIASKASQGMAPQQWEHWIVLPAAEGAALVDQLCDHHQIKWKKRQQTGKPGAGAPCKCKKPIRLNGNGDICRVILLNSLPTAQNPGEHPLDSEPIRLESDSGVSPKDWPARQAELTDISANFVSTSELAFEPKAREKGMREPSPIKRSQGSTIPVPNMVPAPRVIPSAQGIKLSGYATEALRVIERKELAHKATRSVLTNGFKHFESVPGVTSDIHLRIRYDEKRDNPGRGEPKYNNQGNERRREGDLGILPSIDVRRSIDCSTLRLLTTH